MNKGIGSSMQPSSGMKIAWDKGDGFSTEANQEVDEDQEEQKGKWEEGGEEELETILHEVNASVKLLKGWDPLVDVGMVHDTLIKLIPLRVEQDGRVPEIWKRG